MARRHLLTFRPSVLTPDLTLSSVHELSADMLREHAIRCLVFDVDNTLTYHGGGEISRATLSHLQSLRTQTGVSIHIASNSRRNLEHFGRQLEARIIRSTLLSRKPRRVHFRRIVQETGFPPHATAMVGDKLLTDVLGGNLAGMTTIWVLSGRQKFFHSERTTN